MAPRKTRAIGIFANSVCVGSLSLRKSDSSLRVVSGPFVNFGLMAAFGGEADVPNWSNSRKIGSAFGQERTLGRFGLRLGVRCHFCPAPHDPVVAHGQNPQLGIPGPIKAAPG